MRNRINTYTEKATKQIHKYTKPIKTQKKNANFKSEKSMKNEYF